MNRLRRSWRDALVKTLIMIAAGLAPLLAFELAVRYPGAHLPRDLRVAWARHEALTQVHVRHPRLSWAGMPSVSLSGYRWNLRHTPVPGHPEVGYRADAAPDGPIDVAVLGDSFSYGVEVDQSEVWPRRLQVRSGARVVNLAVNSYGTSQEAGWYRLYGATFKARTVIQVVAHNDPLDNLYYQDMLARPEKNSGNLCWFLHLRDGGRACAAVFWIARRSAVADLAIYAVQRRSKINAFDDAAQMTAGTKLICRDLDEVRAFTRSAGARYAVVLIGRWRGRRFAPYRAMLGDCLGRMKVPVLQLDDDEYPDFLGRIDQHWTPEGHDYVAGKIHDFLRALGRLDARGSSSR